MSEGILSPFLKQFSIAGMPVSPKLLNNELVIEITENEIYQVLFKDARPEVKNAIKVELHEGKLVIKLKLF